MSGCLLGCAGAKQPVPEPGGHAEVSIAVNMVVQSMPLLQPVDIACVRGVPMMKDVVDADVPQIADHQAAGHGAGDLEVCEEPNRQEHK